MRHASHGIMPLSKKNYIIFFQKVYNTINKIEKKEIYNKIMEENNSILINNVIEESVKIYPYCYIENSTIKSRSTIYPNSIIINSVIEENTKIYSSFIEESFIGKNVRIGPYAHLRPRSHIKDNCKIGNFVEIKNSIIDEETKASHLSYVGDAEIGKRCNIGCGAIFVNYNGKTKNKIVIKDDCFIGSNVNLIAPLKIDEKTYICAGSTLTKDTKKRDFVIARARETIKSNYSEKYLK